ncbi:MAG: FISUMP domain-containing protein [Mangrovibacterium sp.]
MKTLKTIYWLSAILISLLVSCEREWDNPFDPESPKETWTPVDFSVSQQENTMLLSWGQPAPNISGFKIDRKIGDGEWQSLGTVNGSTFTWTDSQLVEGQTHEYRLKAYAGENESNELTINVTPISLSAVQQENNILLSWSQSVSNITDFKIERKVSDGEWQSLGTVNGSTFTWTDTQLVDEQMHEYRLKAYAGEKESNVLTVSITPLLLYGTFTDARDGREYKWVRIGGRKWMAENLKYRFADYELSSERINGSNNTENQLLPGTILVYQTSEGRPGKMQIQQYGYDMKIRWITYTNTGEVHNSGENLTIRGFWSCDLDTGKETTKGSDFWWEQITVEERYLTPMNNAMFALYPMDVSFEDAVLNIGIFRYNNNLENFDTYGYLYTWETATTAGLCPEGWHLPTDEEWKELELHLGMSQTEANKTSWRGTGEGGKLKETGSSPDGLWNNPNTGATNSSGFTALPGGKWQGGYVNIRRIASFWSSTAGSVGKAWHRELAYDHADLFRDQAYQTDGLSIRCVQD